MERNYIIEGLFILLGLAFVATVIKYPKETVVKLPLGIAYYVVGRPLKSIFLIPVWVIGFPLMYLGKKYNWSITPTIKSLLDTGTDDDRPHPATKILELTLKEETNTFFVMDSSKNIRELINDLVEMLTEKYSVDDFTINTKTTRP